MPCQASAPTSQDPPASAAVPLTRVAVGGLATLHEVRDPQSRTLLRSLGLTDACRLRLCKIGDPCIVQVRATRIGLSWAVAQCLYVLPDPGGDR
jgi:Fe2+ transport system protein FeoA